VKPSIKLKTIFHASLGLKQKSLFLHLFAYSSCHCLLALLFSRRSVCLACFKACKFSGDGCFMCSLKAWFLASIHFINISSASVNQSGRCLTSAGATSSAADLMCSSKSSISSEGVEKMLSSFRLSKNSSTFFWKFFTSLLRRILLSIFGVLFSFFFSVDFVYTLFLSRGPFSR
jgi:hypothetical protein